MIARTGRNKTTARLNFGSKTNEECHQKSLALCLSTYTLLKEQNSKILFYFTFYSAKLLSARNIIDGRGYFFLYPFRVFSPLFLTAGVFRFELFGLSAKKVFFFFKGISLPTVREPKSVLSVRPTACLLFKVPTRWMTAAAADATSH